MISRKDLSPTKSIRSCGTRTVSVPPHCVTYWCQPAWIVCTFSVCLEMWCITGVSAFTNKRMLERSSSSSSSSSPFWWVAFSLLPPFCLLVIFNQPKSYGSKCCGRSRFEAGVNIFSQKIDKGHTPWNESSSIFCCSAPSTTPHSCSKKPPQQSSSKFEAGKRCVAGFTSSPTKPT